MLLKRLTRRAPAPTLPRTLDRREFLKRSGIAAGGAGLAATLPFNLIERAEGETPAAAVGKAELKHTICPHCAVGCSIDATVENGVWTRQEPVFDSPINLGAHCAKGAAAREHGRGEFRLKTPMKLVNGKWQQMSWDDAMKEVSDRLLSIRKESGPDAVFWIGSS